MHSYIVAVSRTGIRSLFCQQPVAQQFHPHTLQPEIFLCKAWEWFYLLKEKVQITPLKFGQVWITPKTNIWSDLLPSTISVGPICPLTRFVFFFCFSTEKLSFNFRFCEVIMHVMIYLFFKYIIKFSVLCLIQFCISSMNLLLDVLTGQNNYK